MGIPRFIVPVDTDATVKATEQNAAQSRSAIRRQRTTRGSEGRRRRWMSMIADSHSQGSDNQGSSSVSNSEPEETRSQLSLERYRLPRPAFDGQSMPPVPESRDYGNRTVEITNEIRASRRLDRAREMGWVSQPRDSTDIGDLVLQPRVAHPWVSNQTDLSPTPEASPPRRTVTDAQELRSRIRSMRRDATRIRDSLSQRRRVLNLDQPDGPVAASRSRLDGLGDRNRSLSPAEWDTLLVGITPDPHPPSVGSSFASSSASAAAASSSASPNPTASTAVTSPERTREFSAARDCEISDPASDDEDDSSIPESGDVASLASAAEPGVGSEVARNRWRRHRDLVAARVDRISRQSQGPADARRADEGDHMDTMHRIIAGLAGREDIPDEWWARAGLRRGPMA